MSSQSTIDKGVRAREIMDDPLIKGAIEDMEQTLFDNFKTSAWYDWKERAEIYRQIKAVDGFRKRFEKYIKDGSNEQATVEHKLRNII